MSGAVVVRRFAAGEWALLRRLRLAALADAPDAFARTLAEEAPRPDAEWARTHAATAGSPDELSLVAEQDAHAVGIVYARSVAGTMHLHAMWVAPAAREQGVGRALVEAVLAWARRRGACAVLLQVTESNGPAIRLYERAGFHFTGASAPLRAGSALRTREMRITLDPQRGVA